LRRATLAWRAKQKSKKTETAKPQHDAIADAEKGEADQDTQDMPPPTRQLLDELVPLALRPTHRVGTFGFMGIGKKVDTIDWCKVRAHFSLHLIC
jgi:calcium permeable stress-gated cation channel